MRIPRWLIRTAETVAALVGAYLLYRVFQKHDLHEIMEAIGELPTKNILACALFSAGSYACLTVSEYLSLRYARAHRLSFGRIAVVTFASLGIGHSVGLSAVSSGAVRYRMYSRSGLDGETVAKIMLFSGITVGLGLVMLFSITMFVHGPIIASFLHISVAYLHWLAAGLIATAALYLLICWRGAPPLKIKRIRLRLPTARLTIAQMIVGSLNFVCIAAALWVCLTPFVEVALSTVITLIILGDAAAIIGHVPGGWGVLEFIVTRALDGPQVIAGIIVFRAVYYLAPLILGVATLMVDELTGRGREEPVRHEAIQRG
jgi:glycosyltransferase 2 family protein